MSVNFCLRSYSFIFSFFFFAGWIACWFYFEHEIDIRKSFIYQCVYKSDNIPGIENHYYYYYYEENFKTRSNGSTILKLIKSMFLCTFVGLITTIGIYITSSLKYLPLNPFFVYVADMNIENWDMRVTTCAVTVEM